MGTSVNPFKARTFVQLVYSSRPITTMNRSDKLTEMLLFKTLHENPQGMGHQAGRGKTLYPHVDITLPRT